MDRTELINFLKENLTIDINISKDYNCESEYISVQVSLGMINEKGTIEEISNSRDSINIR